jgi:serine/threonine-protein kinase
MDTSKIVEATEHLKLGLLAKATDGEYADKDYIEDLRIVSLDNRVSRMLPSFVKTSRSPADFRRAMQAKYPHYADRRQHIDQEFQPIFDYLEGVINGTDNFSGNVDSYELGEPIGNGGFGTVYKYRHKLLDHDFAIKIFEPIFVSNDENIEGENRFFREAKVLFQLNHENIVRVYDIGRINGKPFIRMEFVDGYTLQDFIALNSPVSFARSKKPIIALLNGLSYAHKIGVIHRDLKPSNLMVTKDGKFKIIDFGISAYIENEKHSKLTKTGESIAGGLYTDPVLVGNPKLRDIRSDIYSIGAIWYYLLAGRAPAGGDARKILLASNNATELQSAVILKCLANDPNVRYQSCDEILSVLQPTKSEIAVGNSALYNRLTEITREAIFDCLMDRYSNEINAYVYSQSANFQEPERVFYYSGRRDDVTFLGRLYDLASMPSADSRVKTFEAEIQQHTIANYDYEYGWVFHDDRLGLKSGNDEVLLKFLCEMFHPVVRSEKSDWRSVLEEINALIKADGYEIYESEKISGRSVYTYQFCV